MVIARIKITYLLTVIVSVLLLVIGHEIAVSGLPPGLDNAQEVAGARVKRIIERIEPDDDVDEFLFAQGGRIIFEAEITSGARKGELVTASQGFSDLTRGAAKKIAAGDSILVIGFDNEWYFNGYYRTNKLLILGVLFMFCVLLLGGKKGFNTILSLGLTCAAVFAVFVPAILSGKNIYLAAALVCAYTTIMTLLIVVGYNRKSLGAAVGGISGIAITGIITAVMDRALFLTGMVDEHSRYLTYLPAGIQINLRAIIFAGIIIGAMGAIMDVSTSIASALWEVKEKAGSIEPGPLYRSGLNIGRDILGTMANTLILAYIGCSLSVVLVLSVYTGSLTSLLNSEMIVVEILQALAGSFGILFTIPLTAFFCSRVYTRK